jgi:hypothetical protein
MNHYSDEYHNALAEAHAEYQEEKFDVEIDRLTLRWKQRSQPPKSSEASNLLNRMNRFARKLRTRMNRAVRTRMRTF